MRAVVTGATGNVGSAFLRSAARHPDWTITGVARRLPRPQPPFSAAEWVACDLADSTAAGPLREVLAGADVVVHLAWAIQPGVAEQSLHRTNIIGTRQLLDLMAAAGVPQLVYVSSVAAYAPAPRWHRVDEGQPCTGVPGSAYSQDKARLERVVRAFVERNPAVTVAGARPSAILQREAGAQFARRILSPLLPPTLVGRAVLPMPLWRSLRAQVVHADDVAQALWSMVTLHARGAFNLAAEPVLSAADLAQELGGYLLPVPRSLLSAAALATWRIGIQPLHPGWIMMADRVPLLDTARARGELGWRPEYDGHAALSDMVAGIQEGRGAGSEPMAPWEARPGWPRPSRARPGSPTHQSQADPDT